MKKQQPKLIHDVIPPSYGRNRRFGEPVTLDPDMQVTSFTVKTDKKHWSDITHTFIFWGVYSLIVAGCIIATTRDGWNEFTVIAGIVWGLLCLPGWLSFYAFLTRDKK